MIAYKKGSLFDAPKGSILVHACNAQGVWGAGIAKEFKNRFPESFKYYRRNCVLAEEPQVGKAYLLPLENGYQVGCLITSRCYGEDLDPITIILNQTESALSSLEFYLKLNPKPVYSNKFNSGLFGVPWESTENVLKSVIGDCEWTVMEL